MTLPRDQGDPTRGHSAARAWYAACNVNAVMGTPSLTRTSHDLISRTAARARSANDSSKYPVASGCDIHSAEDPEDPFGLSGMLLGARYRLVRPLGRRATLYQTRRASHGDPLLVRIILGLDLGGSIQRFLGEARAASHLHHGHIARVCDFGVQMLPDGRTVGYLVMEPLNGENLTSTLASQGPLHWTRVLTIAKQICRALIAGHDRHLVHGDLRLANCLRISRRGAPDFIKVLDFGISPGSTGTRDQGDDLEALAALMYRLLTGRTPGPAPSLRHDVPMLGIPAVVADLVVAMLTPECARRSATGRALYRSLLEVEAAAIAPGPIAQNARMVAAGLSAPTSSWVRPAACSHLVASPSRAVAATATPTAAEHRNRRPVTAMRHPSEAAPALPAPASTRRPTWSEWMFWLPLGVMTTMAVHAALRTL